MKEKRNKDRFARKWLFMVIIGPGIFFILYWFFAVNGTTENSAPQSKLPRDFFERGKEVKIENTTLQAGLKDRNIFVQELIIGKNNRVMAQGNERFFIVPVFTDSNSIKKIDKVELIDSKGNRYSALDIEQKYQASAARLRDKEIPRGKQGYYFTFKINKNVKGYYLEIYTKTQKTTWYFDNNS